MYVVCGQKVKWQTPSGGHEAGSLLSSLYPFALSGHVVDARERAHDGFVS